MLRSHLFQILAFQNGESALHASALFGHLNIVKKLIESGADPHLKNKDGQTPHGVAKEGGKEDIATFLATAKKSYSTTV